jgi:quercetin dioxygenase-like cupin family protein
MANIESLTHKVNAGQNRVQEFHPASVVRAGHGIPVDLGATRIELLTSTRGDSYWVMKAILHPGESVPLHAHDDVEDFYVVSGEAEALVQTGQGLEWIAMQPGDFVHIPGNMKHAWRNWHLAPAETIVVTTPKLGRFLQELGELRNGAGNGAMDNLGQLSERYGYWVASAEENAAVGISLPDGHNRNR